MVTQVKMLGTKITSSAVFKDSTGGTILPTSVYFKYKNPAGTVITNLVTNTGWTYTQEVLLSAEGTWNFRWDCDGNYQTADEFEIYVSPSKVI